MRFIQTFIIGIATAGASALLAERSKTPAPYHRPDSEHLVPEGYIVRLRPNHTLEDHFTNLGFDIRQFTSEFFEIHITNAYAFRLTEANNSLIHECIRYDPGVLRVEHNEYLHDEQIGKIEPNPPQTTLFTKLKRWVSKSQRLEAPWNQVMISWGSKRNFGGELEVGRSFSSQWTLVNGGNGVNIYVFDSGIKMEHEAFQIRSGVSMVSHFGGRSSLDVSPYCDSEHSNRFMVRYP